MCVHQTLYPMPFNSWRTPAQKKTSCSTHIFWHVLWVGLNTELCWVSIYSTPPVISNKRQKNIDIDKEYKTAEVLLYQLKGIWKKSLSYTTWTSMTEVGTSLVRRNNASLLLYLPMIQWDLELFKMQTMKEGPLPHIAKYHVQQCLQVSQHYKQLCRNNTPRSTSGKRGTCTQFCFQLSILKHSDIKSKNVVTHLASKSACNTELKC